MRNSNISFDGVADILVAIKKKFPDAIWTIDEPVMEPWRKGRKGRTKPDGTVVPDQPAAPFSVFLCTDPNIGDPGHFFAIIETDDILEGISRAFDRVLEQHEDWSKNK